MSTLRSLTGCRWSGTRAWSTFCACVCACLGVLQRSLSLGIWVSILPQAPVCAFTRDYASKCVPLGVRVSVHMSLHVGSSAQQTLPLVALGAAASSRLVPGAQETALPLDMNPPLSRVLREMLRAQGCKAEPGAGSPWAKRPLQPGLAPRRRLPTRHPAAPPLRPAPARDLASARSSPRRPCPRAPMPPLPPAPRDPRACRLCRGALPFPRLPRQHAGAGTGAQDAQPGKVPASQSLSFSLHPVPSVLPGLGRGRRGQLPATVRVRESRGDWDIALAHRSSAQARLLTEL